MKRYVTKAGWSPDWWLHEPQNGLTVFERDAPRKTGLLDAQGNELFAVDEMEPIGFRMEVAMKKPVKMPMKEMPKKGMPMKPVKKGKGK